MSQIDNTMLAEANAPALQSFESGLFGPIEIPPLAWTKSNLKVGKGSRGTRPVLSWRDFILPELVDHSDNGDLTVKAVSSTEQEHQTLHLVSMAQELSAQIDEVRERKLYIQSLKRNPENEDELAAFRNGSARAEDDFALWLAQKVRRKVRALERKANRLLACAVIVQLGMIEAQEGSSDWSFADEAMAELVVPNLSAWCLGRRNPASRRGAFERHLFETLFLDLFAFLKRWNHEEEASINVAQFVLFPEVNSD